MTINDFDLASSFQNPDPVKITGSGSKKCFRWDGSNLQITIYWSDLFGKSGSHFYKQDPDLKPWSVKLDPDPTWKPGSGQINEKKLSNCFNFGRFEPCQNLNNAQKLPKIRIRIWTWQKWIRIPPKKNGSGSTSLQMWFRILELVFTKLYMNPTWKNPDPDPLSL